MTKAFVELDTPEDTVLIRLDDVIAVHWTDSGNLHVTFRVGPSLLLGDPEGFLYDTVRVALGAPVK